MIRWSLIWSSWRSYKIRWISKTQVLEQLVGAATLPPPPPLLVEMHGWGAVTTLRSSWKRSSPRQRHGSGGVGAAAASTAVKGSSDGSSESGADLARQLH